MRLYAAGVYLFLYLPIAIIALFSFNAGRSASQRCRASRPVVRPRAEQPLRHGCALDLSLTVAFFSAALASVVGTMAALALHRDAGPGARRLRRC